MRRVRQNESATKNEFPAQDRLAGPLRAQAFGRSVSWHAEQSV